ncbi:MAG TPA: cytochrome b/b6 domain-containing protein [Ferruginibacter sp.]|nr:cytochrome b/b6 domain-containing protein [Ferruginibacter sp.]
MNTQIKFTASHRVLHWLMALAMPILFITGFLRMHWMNKNHISGIIESKTNAIPKEQVSEITKAIREPMWVWHEVFAKVMIFAFIARIIYMLVKGIRFPNPFKSNQLLKERLQGFTYLYFYLFVFISAFTGICIEKDLLSAYHDNIEAIHKWGIYWFPIFIVLHLVGIAVAEFSNKKGITSKMIGGD